MAEYMKSMVDSYNDIFNELFVDQRGKPRVDGWLFMSSPWPTFFICVSYVFIVKVLGPWYMKDRPPFQLRNLLVAYNAAQVIFSVWLFYEIGMSGWFTHYSFRCQPVDYSDNPSAIRFGMGGWFRGYSFRCQPVDYSHNPMAIRMTHASWWYYLSKFTEFFDTFFFVLHKKFEHVSTLHVIHHGCMPLSVWFGVKFTPGGHSTFFGFINTFVHIVMYVYYMVAAMGPRYRRYIWWKKYLTNFQMIQFVLIFGHAFQLCFTECNYPRAFMWWIGGHAVMFFFLFSEFYINAYIKGSKGKGKKDALKSEANGHTNGTLLNGYTKLANGHANGHANGYANGKANGFANGYANGHANGHANGSINGNVVQESNGHIHHASESSVSARMRRLVCMNVESAMD